MRQAGAFQTLAKIPNLSLASTRLGAGPWKRGRMPLRRKHTFPSIVVCSLPAFYIKQAGDPTFARVCTPRGAASDARQGRSSVLNFRATDRSIYKGPGSDSASSESQLCTPHGMRMGQPQMPILGVASHSRIGESKPNPLKSAKKPTPENSGSNGGRLADSKSRRMRRA